MTTINEWDGFFVNGDKNNGEFKSWWYDETKKQLRQHSFYENGELHGEYKYYWHDGKLTEHLLYENGKIIKRIIK